MRSESEARQDELLVDGYLESLGLNVARFPKHQSNKRPDRIVTTREGAIFYCEVKSLASPYDEAPITWATMGNAVSEPLHRAAKQFRSINGARLVPNVLAWVSHSYRFSQQFFQDFVRGDVRIQGEPIASLARERFGRAARDLRVVDLHLWFQENDPPTLIFVNEVPTFVRSLSRVFSLSLS